MRTVLRFLTVVMFSWTAVHSAAGGAWEPTPADGPPKPARALLVDFGGDLTRGGGYPSTGFGTARPGKGYLDVEVRHDVDVDGDGETADDCVAYWPCSMGLPLSPRHYPVGDYHTHLTSATFYGGQVGFWANRREPRFVECGCNADHDGPFHDHRADDFAFHARSKDPDPEIKHRLCGVFLFKKEDFLNGGDRHRVTLDEGSRMGALFARYWTDFKEGRYVVQDGDQFWISERTFRGIGEPEDVQFQSNWERGRVHTFYPTTSRWARYDPEGWRIEFDREDARFERHEFRDVRAVGFYLGTYELKKGETWLKWYGFEAEGLVHRPERPSEMIEMRRVTAGRVEGPGGKAVSVPPFYMSTCEVPFALWKDVWVHATQPVIGMNSNYIFASNGDMGSMDLGERAHGPDEPVTDLPWLDAVAWCNALSEREGRTPVYYADPECTRVLRNHHLAATAEYRHDRRHYPPETWIDFPEPTIHVRWDADGYRLPTAAEWARAAGDASAGVGSESDGTRSVGSGPANEFGLHDLTGNVWEYGWTSPDPVDMAPLQEVSALGGGFQGPALRYGHEPWAGSHDIGFRLVRNNPGSEPPPVEANLETIPVREIRRGKKTEGQRTADEKPDLGIELVDVPGGSVVRPQDGVTVRISPFKMGETEVTYGQWKRVYQWSRARGYSYNWDGDMGSMFDRTEAHSADEPVTNVTWHDMVAWCNALSEATGRTPCYYADEDRTTVLREVWRYRPWKQEPDELGIINGGTNAGKTKDGLMQQPVYVAWHADGFRLPTGLEWLFAARGGQQTRFFWGEDFAEATDYGWFSYGHPRQPEDAVVLASTHPAGRKKPNPFGLYDIYGNTMEWAWQPGVGFEPNYFDRQDPKGSWSAPFATRKGGSVQAFGGSYYEPDFGNEGHHGLQVYPYFDRGFRVVRCEAGTHPEAEPTYEPPVILDVDIEQYDPKTGATARGNLARTGVFPGPGVPELSGVKWTFDAAAPVSGHPVAVDGTVYFGDDAGALHALDLETGEEKWSYRTDGPIEVAPAVGEGLVFVPSKDGALHAVDAADGSEVWKRKGSPGELASPTPAVCYDVVFAYMRRAGGLLALDAKTGEVRVEYHRSEWPDPHTALLLHRDKLIIGRGGMGLPCSAVDIRTEVHERFIGTSRIEGTPAFLDGIFYAGNAYGGSVTAVDVAADKRLWTHKVAEDTMEVVAHGVRTGVAVDGERAYFGSMNGSLYAVTVKDGERAWTYATGDSILHSSPAVVGGTVYVGSDDGHLHAVDARTGAARWKFETGGRVRTAPFIAGDIILTGSEDGKLYALH